MNKKRRTKEKIQRQKERREKDRNERLHKEQLYNSLFDIEAFIRAYYKSLKNVGWKDSVQRHKTSPLKYLSADVDKFRRNDFSVAINERRVIICERGKARLIVPIMFGQRVIEHVICDEILLPIFTPTLIHANGASLSGKGTDFSRGLIRKYMDTAVRDGYEYAVRFDFKSYFDNIPHSLIKKCLTKEIQDEDVCTLVMNVVYAFKHGDYNILLKRGEITQEEYDQRITALYHCEDKGICLGSQVSQIFALLVPNELDHYIKDCQRMKYYVRYMDDGIVLCKDREQAEHLLCGIKKKTDKMGLVLNEKKTGIVGLSDGFTFLKVRYYVKDGKVIRKLHKAGVTRMRRKLKKFVSKVESGELSPEQVFNSFQSWWSHSFVAQSYQIRIRMLALYKELFGYRAEWFEQRLAKMHPVHS